MRPKCFTKFGLTAFLTQSVNKFSANLTYFDCLTSAKFLDLKNLWIFSVVKPRSMKIIKSANIWLTEMTRLYNRLSDHSTNQFN